MQKSCIISINISDKKGISKRPLTKGFLKKGIGLIGDAHSGSEKRQLSLLALESIKRVQTQNLVIKPGDFAENITTEGIELHTIPLGTHLILGTVEVEITQIGKECILGCTIRKLIGDCIMPREGIFVRIINSGVIQIGDLIYIHSK